MLATRKFPCLVLGLLCALGVIAYWSGMGIQADNRPSAWGAGGGTEDGFSILRSEFGGDESVLVRLKGVQSDEDFAFAEGLGDRLLGLPGVAQVVSPFQVKWRSLLGRKQTIEDLAERPLVQDLDLVGVEEGRIDWVLMMRAAYDEQTLTALDRELHGLRQEIEGRGLKTRVAGHPLLAHALDEESRRVQTVFAPLLAGVTLLGLILVLRSLRRGILIVLVASVGALLPRAIQAGLGWSLDLVTVAAGPLTFVILVAASLHLQSAWRRLRVAGHSPWEAAQGAVRIKRTSACLSALTTAIGFGVFVVSDVEAVQRLGCLMALVVPLTVLMMFLTLPTLLCGFGGAVPNHRRHGTRPWRRAARLAVRHRTAILCSGFLLLVAGACTPFLLNRNTSALDFFPRGHAVREEFLALEEDEGAALSTIEIVVGKDGKERVSIRDFSGDLGKRLRAIDEVRGVVGPGTIVREVRHVLGRAGMMTVLPLVMSRSGRVAQDGRYVRWTLRVPTRDAEHLAKIVDAVKAVTQQAPELEGLQVHVTGTMVRVFAMQEALLDTLTLSLGLALLAVACVIFCLTRCIEETLTALMVNLVPVGTALLMAAATGLGLDAATVMVAAVVLGVSVDNTVHYFTSVGSRAGRNAPGNRLRALARVGAPAAISALALAGGFLALVVSGFRPTAAFGFLTSVGVAASIPANLFLLPALWLRGKAQG